MITPKQAYDAVKKETGKDISSGCIFKTGWLFVIGDDGFEMDPYYYVNGLNGKVSGYPVNFDTIAEVSNAFNSKPLDLGNLK